MALAAVAGCAAVGPTFTPAAKPDTEEALIYVYREPALALAAREAAFYVDGKQVFNLASGGYSMVYVATGDHVLTQDWIRWLGFWPTDYEGLEQKIDLPLKLTPGEARYFRFSATIERDYFVWRLGEVPAAVGNEEIADNRLQAPSTPRLGHTNQ